MHSCLQMQTQLCVILSSFKKVCFPPWLQKTKSFDIELKLFIRDNLGRMTMLYPSGGLSEAIIIRDIKIVQCHSKSRHQDTTWSIHTIVIVLKRCPGIKNRQPCVKKSVESLFQLLSSPSFLRCCIFIRYTVSASRPLYSMCLPTGYLVCWGSQSLCSSGGKRQQSPWRSSTLSFSLPAVGWGLTSFI